MDFKLYRYYRIQAYEGCITILLFRIFLSLSMTDIKKIHLLVVNKERIATCHRNDVWALNRKKLHNIFSSIIFRKIIQFAGTRTRIMDESFESYMYGLCTHIYTRIYTYMYVQCNYDWWFAKRFLLMSGSP